jgi:hypothetical protein
MKCYITGTIMANRKEYPSGIRAKFPFHETRAYRNGDILILAWGDKRVVLMCSTWYTVETQVVCRKNKKTETDKIFRKPCVISDYTKNMGDVDTADHYNSTYCSLHKSIKLWQKLFFWGLYAAIVNAYHLYRLKAIDANNKPMTHLQFRRKLVEELSADRIPVWGSKSGVVPPQMMRQKDLMANSILYMLMRTAIPMTVQCVRIGKSRVRVVKLCIIVQHAPGNLDFILEFVLNYTIRR